MDDALLNRLAGVITEGLRPDWEAAASTATTSAQRQLLEDLKIVANLAALHRNLDAVAGEHPSAAGATWGPLELRVEIGRGHFGTVYLAWDRALERHVAL